MAHAYPPFATRVEVSYWALQEAQRNESLTQSAWQAWKDFERKFPQPAAYQVQCPTRVVQKLAETCSAQIDRFLVGSKNRIRGWSCRR